MRISQIQLKGFRNFKNSTINFENSTLIIGANDIGKTNLLYAMRLLLDKSLSILDIESKDTDFYLFEDTNEISIVLKLVDCKEDCILSRINRINDNGELYLEYIATKGLNEPAIYMGPSIEALEKIDDRSVYLRAFNMKYISSNRDLFSYIKRERRYILQEAREIRSEQEVKEDNENLEKLSGLRSDVSGLVSNLSYIKKSTESINTELQNLSFHNSDQNIVFDSSARDSLEYIDNLDLVSNVKGKKTVIGGDGRNNQIFIALWAARNGMYKETTDAQEITLYCVEEPEAHLHPHQQRKLAEYLADNTHSQVFITSHSPQIASEFSPDSIVRLHEKDSATVAASNGCCKRISDSFYELGYRLNIIPAESFFARVVLLVEGPSEVLFYKALARQLSIDIDRLNISIVMVDGVGFDTYAKLYSSLEIDYVVRTDNDVFKVPKKDLKHFSGLKRCLELYKNYHLGKSADLETLMNEEDFDANLEWDIKQETIPPKCQELYVKAKEKLEKIDIFLSDEDLEKDLIKSPLKKYIEELKNENDIPDDELEKFMKHRKATFMYGFLQKYADKLTEIKDHSLEKPLYATKKIVERGGSN